MPITPPGNSSISAARQLAKPKTRAMPSPTWITVPRSSSLSSLPYCSISSLRIATIFF